MARERDPTTAGGTERRSAPRIASANLINFREIAGRRDAVPEEAIYAILGTARTIDLSPGGCRLRSTERLPAGAQLAFDLQLGELIVSAVGTVVRVDPVDGGFEAGVRFDDLDDLARDGIRLYLVMKDGIGGAGPT